LYPSNLKIVN